MPAPTRMPLGLQLAVTARTVGRAFEQALTDAGGSRHVWLLLLSVKARGTVVQRELAEAVGLRDATVSHHLAALERDGLVSRRRDPGNRRTQLVALTDEGEQVFVRLRSAAAAFDRRLRTDLREDEQHRLEALLQRLSANVSAS